MLCRGTDEERLEYAFNTFDLDGDGSVDVSELRAMLRALTPPEHRDERRIFNLAQEIIAEAGPMAGSAASGLSVFWRRNAVANEARLGSGSDR